LCLGVDLLHRHPELLTPAGAPCQPHPALKAKVSEQDSLCAAGKPGTMQPGPAGTSTPGVRRHQRPH
jgi:hypothetical protein